MNFVEGVRDQYRDPYIDMTFNICTLEYFLI